jgi:hypothetical protein
MERYGMTVGQTALQHSEEVRHLVCKRESISTLGLQAREHQHTWYAHFRTSRHFPPKNDCNVCAYVCVSADVRMCAYILCTRARAHTHTHTHMTWGRCLDDDEIRFVDEIRV